MRREARIILIICIFYVFASLFDTVTTYYNIYVVRNYYEVNPFNRVLIYNYPPWVWFLRDIIVLGILLLITLGTKKAVILMGKLVNRPDLIKKSNYCLIIVIIPTILKFLGGIHNILVLYGINTCLSRIYGLF